MAVGDLVKVKAGTGVWTYRMKYPTVQSNKEKISSKCVRRGLIELSTISHGCTPGFKLLGQGLVQTADAAGTGSHSHQRVSHFPYFLRTGTRDKHLRQSFGNLWLITTG